MSWASRRRTVYASGVILFFAVVVGVPLALYLYRAPTCFDGKQNQGETAIDLGGPCQALDSERVASETVLWSRAFPVRPGEYAAVAYIQNPNRDAAALLVPYRFSLYDSANVLVAEREGVVTIMPGGITPVYEGKITTGNRVVARTFFELTGSVNWVRAGNPAAALLTSNTKVTADSATPTIAVDVRNTDVSARKQVAIVAVVFDSLGNAFAASRTLIPELAGDEEKHIVFTWPDSFAANPVRTDIIPVMVPELQ